MLRLSTKMRNSLLDSAGLGSIFKGGIIQLYSGSQPATADLAASGTLLVNIVPVIYTTGSGGLPPAPFIVNSAATATDIISETAHGLLDKQPVIFTGGTGGSGVTRGTVYYVINKTTDTFQISTTPTGAALDLGSDFGAADVTCSPCGLVFETAATAGTLPKGSSHTWSGYGLAAGTIGWGRFCALLTDLGTGASKTLNVTDGSAGATGATLAKFDFSVGTSGADLNMSSLVVAVNAVNTVDTFDFTIPTN